MTFRQTHLSGETQVLDAAIELLAKYQSQYGVKTIELNLSANGDIDVSIVPSVHRNEARIPYGRVEKLTKRLARTASR
jgi:hypothetical protein